MISQPSNTKNPAAQAGAGIKAAAIAIAPAVILAAAVSVLNPGLQFERGLASAAADEARIMALNDRTPVQMASTAVASRSFEEGSEGFWLSHGPDTAIDRVSWRAPVAAGDRVIVHLGASDRQVIDVVSVEQADATTRIDTGDGKSARYVITGRRLSDPADGLVRLTVDAEGHGLTTIATSHDRAL